MPKIYKILLIIFLMTASIIPSYSILAETVTELRQKSSSLNDEIKKLDEEIKIINKKLLTTGDEKQTLSNELGKIETTRKKLMTELSLTSTKIKKTNVNLAQLQNDIGIKTQDIEQNKISIAEAIRNLRQSEFSNLLEIFLGENKLSDFFIQTENLDKLQANLDDQVLSLKQNKDILEVKKTTTETEKKKLGDLKNQLAGQKQVTEAIKKEKDQLLTETENKESNYQNLLKERIAQKKAFDEEMQSIEQNIKFLIDPESFPVAKKGIFSWPLDTIRITQEFGGTQFAKNNSGIYGRPYHPGVDFGTQSGSKVKSIASGIVKGFDNTDAYPGCYAWGKWILVEHDNGLSSLYAHLSVISVQKGQRVTGGQLIGFSGSTGVSTGPHLHLGLYASQGVKITKYGYYRPGSKGCAATNASGPFADTDAYLNPLDYLPKP